MPLRTRAQHRRLRPINGPAPNHALAFKHRPLPSTGRSGVSGFEFHKSAWDAGAAYGQAGSPAIRLITETQGHGCHRRVGRWPTACGGGSQLNSSEFVTCISYLGPVAQRDMPTAGVTAALVALTPRLCCFLWLVLGDPLILLCSAGQGLFLCKLKHLLPRRSLQN